MSEAALSARAQTIKQAKAAYKTRNSPALSEREKKQLERSIELERRAWRFREIEKRKAEAAKKRVEKEKREREEQARIQMGTQRRCDKFGYKSSQMHLGTFLNKTRRAGVMCVTEDVSAAEDEEEDSFGDSGLDDETLLDAVADGRVAVVEDGSKGTTTQVATSPTHVNTSQNVPQRPDPAVVQDISSFFDDLGTSTQIARDLSADEAPAQHEQQLPQRQISTATASFSSGEFELTNDELDELEASAVAMERNDQDRTMIPPPPKARDQARKLMPPPPSRKIDHASQLMPPPPLPVKPVQAAFAAHGLSAEQLDFLVDDDLQLTQMDPG